MRGYPFSIKRCFQKIFSRKFSSKKYDFVIFVIDYNFLYLCRKKFYFMAIKKQLNETIREMYFKGLIDETFVMEAVHSTIGGECKKSDAKQDIYDHIDFWWDSPKMGRIGIDVKGIKKANRSDKEYDDTINWLELLNVRGNPGWIYGKSTYIAFRTLTNILFVKTVKLQEYVNEKVKGKQLVRENPKEFYVPYQRKGRQDMIIKVPTSDLVEICDFTIEI